MTKKHFVAMATTLYRIRPDRDTNHVGYKEWEYFVYLLCDFFKEENELFNKDKFLVACGAIRGKEK